MQNFKGLLPRNLLSDDAIGALIKRSEEFRKITIQSTEITTSILKVFEAYLLQLPRIMGFLLGEEKENSENFYVHMKEIYLEIYKDYENFISDTLQAPSNEISNYNALKWSNFSGFLLTFQQQLKNYRSTENSIFEIVKKYSKNQKLLASSIEAYKESFTEAKLIYNQVEKIKRYSACENYSQTSAQDLSNIEDSKEGLYNLKKELIKSFELLSQEMSNSENEIDIKTFKFLSKFNFEYCQSLKRRLEIIKENKTKLESIKELQFFRGFNLHDRNEMSDRRERRVIKFSETFGKGKTEIGFEQIKKLNLKIEKFVETKKLEHQKIYEFHIEFYKTAEKKCLVQLKESLLSFEKNHKKIKEQFQAPCCEELKNTFAIIRATLDIYTEIQKRIAPKIQIISDVFEEYKLILKSMQQEIFSITQKTMEESKGVEFVDSEVYNKKVGTIEMMIYFNEEKLKDCLTLVRTNYLDILNIYETSIKESYEKFEWIGNHSAEIFEKMINKTKEVKVERLKNSVFFELLKEENKCLISFESTERNNDFKKLKKPTEIEVIEKDKEGINTNKEDEEECMPDGDENYDESPVKNTTKHLNFLKTKINFVEGEEIIRTFSCALADKIILQGRLYVTNLRLCFFSKFNTSNVFFGETLIQVPTKDIMRLEKRKNGIFFDNSISITTIKGEVFLTSFFKRNEAFNLISQIIGINQDEEAYEIEEETQKECESVGHRNASESIVTSSFEIEMADDIKEEEIRSRAEEIKEMQNDFNFNFKELAHAEFSFKSFSAYKVLKLFLLNNEDLKINGKKYNNFLEYFKTVIVLHKDLISSDYEPSLKEHLNPENIKSSCPLKVTKNVSATTPIPNPGIPFMPKTAKTTENHELYIISKHRWELNNTVETTGAPYTDSFKINFRTICESTEESCKIVSMIFVNFHKNVMVKGMIENRTFEESTGQFKKQYDELKKCIAQQVKQEKKKLQISCMVPEKGNDETCITTANSFDKDELNEKIKELEEELNINKEKTQKEIKELTKSVSIYRTVLISAIGFYLLSIFAWLS